MRRMGLCRALAGLFSLHTRIQDIDCFLISRANATNCPGLCTRSTFAQHYCGPMNPGADDPNYPMFTFCAYPGYCSDTDMVRCGGH